MSTTAVAIWAILKPILIPLSTVLGSFLSGFLTRHLIQKKPEVPNA